MYVLFAVIFAGVVTACQAAEPELGGFPLHTFPPPGNPPILRLLDAGQEPKRVLRYRFPRGTTYGMQMTIQGSAVPEGAERSSPIKMPRMRIPGLVRILEANDQEARCEISTPAEPEMSETQGIEPKHLEKLRETLRGLQSASGSAIITDRGIVRKSEFTFPADLSPELKQSLQYVEQSSEQLSVPLPIEAVGPGARWKTLSRVVQGGSALYQVSTWELRQLDWPSLSLGVTVEALSPEEIVQVPGEPAGAIVATVSVTSRGQGETLVDLRTPVRRGTMSMHMEVVTSIHAKGRSVRLVTKVDMQMATELGSSR